MTQQQDNHNSPTYEVQKAAFELLSSNAWRLVLFPLIEQIIHSEEKIPIISLDGAFKAAQAQGRSVFARGLVTHVETLASQFAKRG